MKKLYLIALLILFPLVAFGEGQQISDIASLEDSKLYKDPQGYFELLLPAGWKILDEYADDPRGKVLLAGQNNEIKLRIIVGGGDTNTLEDLKQNAEQVISQLPNLRTYMGKVNNWDAVIIEGVIGGEYNRMFSFIAENEAHSFSFIGPKSYIETEWNALERVLQTYLPIKAGSSEEVRAQQSLAHWIRLSELMFSIGDIEGARANLKEASRVAPNSPKVAELAKIIGATEPKSNDLSKSISSTEGSLKSDTVHTGAEETISITSKDAGMVFYALSFFLLWLPVGGAAVAALAGFIGIRYFVQNDAVGGFAPLVIFWFLVTVGVVFSIFFYPIEFVLSVWGDWYQKNYVLPFVICAIGGIALGLIIFYSIHKARKLMEEKKLQTMREEDLKKALKSQSWDAAEKLIQQGVRLNKEEDGVTLVGRAAAAGGIDTVKLMLSMGGDPNAGSKSPLYNACKNGRYEMVRVLLEHGVKSNPSFLTFSSGAGIWVPFEIACEKGHRDIVELLIEKGANIEKGFYKPIEKAAMNGHGDIVKILLAAGAKKPNKATLKYVSERGFTEVIKVVDGCSID